MRVFLTGGTGFIGLALIDRLLSANAEVVSVAPVPPPEWAKTTLNGADFRIGDVTNRDDIEAMMRDTKPDVVINGGAATPGDARERQGPSSEIVAINVGGTANVIETAAKLGIGRVMSFSSSSVYGRTVAEVDMLDEETTECRPANVYAITKFAAEKIAHRLGAVHGIEVITPRLLAAWGPWEYRTGVRQTLSPGFQILEALASGLDPDLTAGSRMPMIYSDHAADMLVRLLKAESPPGIANVGVTEAIDLEELAKAARARLSPKLSGDRQQIDLFGAERPPMAIKRLTDCIGPTPQPDVTELVDRYCDWLDQGAHRGALG